MYTSSKRNAIYHSSLLLMKRKFVQIMHEVTMNGHIIVTPLHAYNIYGDTKWLLYKMSEKHN